MRLRSCDVVFCAIVCLLLAACSPPENSQKKAAEAAFDRRIAADGWEAEKSKDAFTDQTVYKVQKEMAVDDDANGKLQIELAYSAGEPSFSLQLVYLNDRANRDGSCEQVNLRRNYTLIGYVVPLQTRNERGEIRSLRQDQTAQNCNAVTIHYNIKEAEGFFQNSPPRDVLLSQDFRLKVPLESVSQDVVIKMDFQNNAVLRAFALTALAGIEAQMPKAADNDESREKAPQSAPAALPAPEAAKQEPVHQEPEKPEPAKQAPIAAPAKPEPLQGPSFSCTAANQEAEALVCSSPDLAAMDRRYAAMYAAVMRDLRDQDPMEADRVRTRARAFIQERNGCRGSKACIEKTYRGITAALSQYAVASGL